MELDFSLARKIKEKNNRQMTDEIQKDEPWQVKSLEDLHVGTSDVIEQS